MELKTKAAMQGRQCHYIKQIPLKHTRLNVIGQSLTNSEISGTPPLAGLKDVSKTGRIMISRAQPLGLNPWLNNFARQASFTHELNWPGPAAILICSNSSSSKRMFFFVLPERSNPAFVFLSCIGTYHGDRLETSWYVPLFICATMKITKPRTVRAVAGLLTANVNRTNAMAGSQHTQTRPEYQYRFLALSATEQNIVHITAASESEARKKSPYGCVMVFAGRLPVCGGMSHA